MGPPLRALSEGSDGRTERQWGWRARKLQERRKQSCSNETAKGQSSKWNKY
jgi:hypothetical protein